MTLRNSAVLLCILGLPRCGGKEAMFLGPSADPMPVVQLAEVGEQAKTPTHRKGSYIVMFKTENRQDNLFFSSFAEEYQHHYLSLNSSFGEDDRIRDMDILSAIDLSGGLTDWEPEFTLPMALKQAFGSPEIEAREAGVLVKVDFKDEDAAAEVLNEWNDESRIWFAEPNGLSYLSQGTLKQWGTDYASMQHWHKTIKLPDAFNTLAGGKIAEESSILSTNPIVAVLDSGVDYAHASLKDNMWVNQAVGAAGCSNDTYGCNTTAPERGSLGNGEVWPVGATQAGVACSSSGKDSKCDHGTHVAGIIAAKPDTSSQIAGVCPMCRIMALRVAQIEKDDTSAEPSISDDSQIRAFKYLTRFRKNGGSAVRLVNASFGKYARSRSLSILVDVLRKSGTGTLVVAAASNEDSMIRTYPAALSNAVAVSSVGADSDPSSVEKSSFSNYGSWVDIAAPGASINSTISGDSKGIKQGTSMAAPVVAGAAGLLLAAKPDLGFSELKDRILLSANANTLYGTDTEGGKINNQYYYSKVSGEAVRRPLLGSGLVDVNAMILGTKNTSTGQPLDRVTAGCAVLDGEERAYSAAWFWCIFVTPFLTMLLGRWLFRKVLGHG